MGGKEVMRPSVIQLRVIQTVASRSGLQVQGCGVFPTFMIFARLLFVVLNFVLWTMLDLFVLVLKKRNFTHKNKTPPLSVDSVFY